MLELMKELLGVDLKDTSRDRKLNHYLNKSQNAIKNYLNKDDLTGLDDSIVDLAIFYYRNPDGVIQATQGSRTKTVEKGIPQSIKDTLPLPSIKMLG